jgi:hypothetical protein
MIDGINKVAPDYNHVNVKSGGTAFGEFLEIGSLRFFSIDDLPGPPRPREWQRAPENPGREVSALRGHRGLRKHEVPQNSVSARLHRNAIKRVAWSMWMP